MSNFKFKIQADGGSRGNPGPASIGVVIQGEQISKKEYGEYIGETTNNEAEYQAVIFALKKLKHLIGSEKAAISNVEVTIDSELLSKQLNGQYKIKEKNLQSLFLEIWNLKIDFGQIAFVHVLRGKNKDADRIVNQVLDKEQNKLKL